MKQSTPRRTEEISGSTLNMAELERLLEGWACCKAPSLCGAMCQDDELSSVLALAYRLVSADNKLGGSHT